MHGPFFAPRATRELQEAFERIAQNRPAVAEAFMAAVLQAAENVAARPMIGSTRPYVPTRYRFWSLTRYSYLLVYDAGTEPVIILRLVHARRDCHASFGTFQTDLQPQLNRTRT